jgi:hypothetical protein
VAAFFMQPTTMNRDDFVGSAATRFSTMQIHPMKAFSRSTPLDGSRVTKVSGDGSG